jgi:putative membrane protein
VKLDRRSIPYRVVENGIAVGAVLVFGVLGPTADQGSAGLLGGAAIVLVGVALTVGWQVARWRRFEYDLTPDTFDIASGVLSRRNREIPYERIQNVDISQNPVQRLLDIAAVRLETAGGSETEAALKYVSSSEADRLQNAVSERKRRVDERAAAAPAWAPAEEELFELQTSELGVLGLVTADLRLVGLVASFAPFVAPVILEEIDPGLNLLLVGGAFLGVVVVLVLWAASGVYAVLRYYGFRLYRRGHELRYERGLLQRYSGTIPVAKVQTVSLAENVLARRLGYASVSIETAGYAPGQTQGQRVQSAVPVAKRSHALSLARQVEPFGDLSFERPPKRARLRYVVRYSLVVLVLAGLLAGVDAWGDWVPWWPASLALLALVPPAAHLKWANLGYHLGEDHVVTQRGFWVRSTSVVPYHRVQTVLRSRTVFQRRRNLGTLVVDTASGGGFRGSDAVALDIDAGRAATLLETVDERLQAALPRRRDETADRP